jgi:hypothetical protein
MTKLTKTNLQTGEDITIQFYDSVETLPIKRYQLLQKYSLIDGGIGSTFEDILRHFQKFDNFIEVKDMDSLITERENLMMNFSFMLDQKSTASYMLATMIKSLDGQSTEVNDENIDELVELLECLDISYYEIERVIETQKKSLVRA